MTMDLFSDKSGKIDWKIPAILSRSSVASSSPLLLTNAGIDAVVFGVLGFLFDLGRPIDPGRCPDPAAGEGEIILSVSVSVVSPETTIFGASSEIDIL